MRFREHLSPGATTVADNRYNALGQRVNKTTASADVDFVYDLNGQLLGVSIPNWSCSSAW